LKVFAISVGSEMVVLLCKMVLGVSLQLLLSDIIDLIPFQNS